MREARRGGRGVDRGPRLSWLSRVAVAPASWARSSRIATNRQLQTLVQCRSRRFTASLLSRSVLYFVRNVVVTIVFNVPKNNALVAADPATPMVLAYLSTTS